MQGVKVTIVQYISDDPQPGIVECQLEDAHGRKWSIVEKTAIVSAENLDDKTTYPRQGVVDCAIVGRSLDSAGREVARINTLESIEGVSQFDVLPESLVEW